MAPNSAIDGTQALKFAQQCYDAKPEDGVAIGLLGATYFRVGRYEEAAERLTECLDIEEGHFNKLGTQAFGYLFLAMTHHRLGHPMRPETGSIAGWNLSTRAKAS